MNKVKLLQDTDNYTIKVTKIEVSDTGFFGTDLGITVDVIDKETNKVIIESEYFNIENAYQGFEHDEETIDYNLELLVEKSFEDYDWDWNNIPKDIQKKLDEKFIEDIETYILEDIEEYGLSDILYEKILKRVASWYNNEFYIINGDVVNIYTVETDYFGTHVSGYNNNNKIQKLYCIDTESYDTIFLDGVYFKIESDWVSKPKILIETVDYDPKEFVKNPKFDENGNLIK